ncbi:hypothetical protein BG004_003597 [Podila humilis]|nr:hypothetical protein BG004_003597 [Podila humilis]
MAPIAPHVITTDNNGINSPVTVSSAQGSRIDQQDNNNSNHNSNLAIVLEHAHQSLSSVAGAPFISTQSAMDQTSLNLQSTLHHLSEVSKNLGRSTTNLATLNAEMRNVCSYLPPNEN